MLDDSEVVRIEDHPVDVERMLIGVCFCISQLEVMVAAENDQVRQVFEPYPRPLLLSPITYLLTDTEYRAYHWSKHRMQYTLGLYRKDKLPRRTNNK